MENWLLEEIKADYVRRKEERANLNKLYSELAELEATPQVKRYLALQEEIKRVKFIKNIMVSDEELLDLSFRTHQYRIKNTNEIYVCLGTFRLDSCCDIVHGPSDIRLKYDDPKAEYRTYRNIEDGYSKQIAIKNCPQFEVTHKVIFPETSRTDRFYYELQREFITAMIEEGQEVACAKILARTKL